MNIQKNNQVNAILEKLKNNKLIAGIIVFGIVIISLSQFTEAITKIFNNIKTIGIFTDNKTGGGSNNNSNSKGEPNKKPDPGGYSDEGQSHPIDSQKEKLVVFAILPARMSGSHIYVNGDPAKILNQTQTVVTIELLREANKNYTITAVKDENKCKKDVSFAKNRDNIYVCQ